MAEPKPRVARATEERPPKELCDPTGAQHVELIAFIRIPNQPRQQGLVSGPLGAPEQKPMTHFCHAYSSERKKQKDSSVTSLST